MKKFGAHLGEFFKFSKFEIPSFVQVYQWSDLYEETEPKQEKKVDVAEVKKVEKKIEKEKSEEKEKFEQKEKSEVVEKSEDKEKSEEKPKE